MSKRLSTLAIAIATVLAGCAAPGVKDRNVAIASLPYRSDGTLFMVPVSVNGAEPAWFTVDSGASHSVLDTRLVDAQRLTRLGPGATTGVGAGSVNLTRIAPTRFAVGPLTYTVQEPWEIGLSELSLPPDTRGLLGSELFKTYVVRIDPDAKSITIYDPARFDPGDEAWIPLIVQGDRLYVDVILEPRPGIRTTSRARVDTGSTSSVNDPAAREAAETRGVTLGVGLGASFEGVSGRYHSVQLGAFKFNNVWGPGGPNPSIGMEMMRRFVVTFDAPRGRMYLRPASAFGEEVPAPPT